MTTQWTTRNRFRLHYSLKMNTHEDYVKFWDELGVDQQCDATLKFLGDWNMEEYVYQLGTNGSVGCRRRRHPNDLRGESLEQERAGTS